MADINNKPKLQLRSGLSFTGEKAPSPSTKLLINHGKPNFTIQRSPKIMNGNGATHGPWSSPVPPAVAKVSPSSPAPPIKSIQSNEFVVKTNSFNGILKPSSLGKAALQQNNQEEHEMTKVVLRRAKVSAEPALKADEDENVPEFIRRQRRIQERLAKENVLDFENRRSGYFTQVMISPTSPNRQSFAETMSSPAIMPGLEMPPSPSPMATTQREMNIPENPEEEEPQHQESLEEMKNEAVVTAVPVSLNGHGDEEEVNRAIEEVNKAVAGEDDDKSPGEDFQQDECTSAKVSYTENIQEETLHKEITEIIESAVVVTSSVETTTATSSNSLQSQETKETTRVLQSGSHVTEVISTSKQVEITSSQLKEEEEITHQFNGHSNANATQTFLNSERADSQLNGHAKKSSVSNGHADEITISHTNGSSTPSLPTPDPSGEKGVNFEPKTVVSFAQELGSDVNKYPDTVVITKDVKTSELEGNEELKEMAKLKFEIKSDQQEIQVTPVLKVD